MVQFPLVHGDVKARDGARTLAPDMRTDAQSSELLEFLRYFSLKSGPWTRAMDPSAA